MQIQQVNTGEVRRLSGAQNDRLERFIASISRSSDRRIFDDRVVDLLLKYARDPEFIQSVIKYADSIGYASSLIEPSQLEEQLDNFKSENRPQPRHWMKAFKLSKRRMIKLFSKMELEPLIFQSGEEIRDCLSTLATHAGYEFILSGKRKKNEYTVEEMYQLFQEAILEALSNGRIDVDILIGTRSQASGAFDDLGNPTGTFKAKTRLISMVAFRVVMLELMFARPLQNAMGDQKAEFYAGGYTDQELNLVLQRWRAHQEEWVSLDYSKFDQSIPAWLITEAFDVCKAAFTEWSEFSEQIWLAIQYNFIHKRFVGPKGIVEAHHGVPSGSMFTQIIDTVVNMLMIYTYLYAKGKDDNWINHHFRMMIMGDDNIMFMSFWRIDLDDLAGYLAHNFGIVMNESKSSRGTRRDDPEFLSRSWTPQGGWKLHQDVVLKVAFPERFRDYLGKGMRPELVLFSYCLSFPVSLREMIYLSRFLGDFNLSLRRVDLGPEYWTGSASYRNVYLSKRGKIPRGQYRVREEALLRSLYSREFPKLA